MRIRQFSKVEVLQLTELGFTVDPVTWVVTGLTDAILIRHLVGGKARLAFLKKQGLR